MSLVQIHQSVCASCRLRSLIVAKQFARARVVPSTTARWSKAPAAISGVRQFHATVPSRQDQGREESIVRRLEEQLQSLDAELEADLQGLDPTTAEDVDFEWSPDSSLSPVEVARQARQQFGDSLPEDILDEQEYKAYERLFGPPIRITKPGEEDELEYEENETLDELNEESDIGTGILREGKDGQLEEIEFVDEAEELEMEEEEEEEEGLDDKTLADLAALRVEEAEAGEENNNSDQAEEDEGFTDFMRTHPITEANRFATPSSTIQLPKSTFVDPISILMSDLSHKHVSESAHRIFGGPGLPYSASTPRRGLSMPQKPIPLDPYQGRMSEMDADVYTATVMPAVYATAYSIMVETRKRLGSSWLEGLLNKEGGPRILDAGGAGAGVLAAREVMRAEWERMHDTSDDPDAVTHLAEADGKVGGELIPAPMGKATVLTGSDALRHRASTLLDATTFLPRLPDYIHATDGEAKERGKFDIIFAPHTLWQIKEEHARKRHVANLWSLLSNDGGVLILFEKGIPRGFEMVAAAREMLLDTRLASPGKEDVSEDIYGGPDSHGNQWGRAPKDKGMIIAPCTNHFECPMYVKGSGISKGRKDVCHFHQRYIRPPFLQKILGAKDRNHEDVDFSYLSIMRGRDLRDRDEQGIVQGESATLAAFTGYEDPEEVAAALSQHHAEKQAERDLDPTAPAIPDVDELYQTSAINVDGSEPHSLSLPRAVMPPMKRQGHVILDVCTPSGTLERWTVPRSFSKQAYRDARKASWGDLWALGAKTRTVRNLRVGGETDAKKNKKAGRQGKNARAAEAAAAASRVDADGVTLDVKGKSRKSKRGGQGRPEAPTTKSGKNIIEVGYDSQGNIKEEDIRVRQSGRMRHGKKIKGIRDKRDKKGLGNGRRKSALDDD